MATKKEYRLLMLTVSDLVQELLNDGRKDDQELPQGRIEEMIEENTDLLDDICEQFRDTLFSELGYEDKEAPNDEEEEDDEEEDEYEEEEDE